MQLAPERRQKPSAENAARYQEISRGVSLLFCNFHGNVQGLDGMGQRPDGNDVHAGFRHRPQCFVRDTAAGLQQRTVPPVGPARRPAQLRCLLHGGTVHVVQHNDIGSGLQGLLDLLQIACLHLQLDHVAQLLPDQGNGGRDTARSVNMVVLKHGAVRQVEPVVAPTAHGNGILLHGPQAGQGLSCIGNGGVGALHDVHRPAGGRGHAGPNAAAD